jgi:hypothetical protein
MATVLTQKTRRILDNHIAQQKGKDCHSTLPSAAQKGGAEWTPRLCDGRPQLQRLFLPLSGALVQVTCSSHMGHTWSLLIRLCFFLPSPVAIHRTL